MDDMKYVLRYVGGYGEDGGDTIAVFDTFEAGLLYRNEHAQERSRSVGDYALFSVEYNPEVSEATKLRQELAIATAQVAELQRQLQQRDARQNLDSFDFDSLWDFEYIPAVKEVREKTGVGLKEAKEAVDRFIAKKPHIIKGKLFERTDGTKVVYKQAMRVAERSWEGCTSPDCNTHYEKYKPGSN